MSLNVWWSSDVPQEIKEALNPILLAQLDLVPTWVHELVIKWDANSTFAAYISSESEYRIARMTVTGYWLDSDGEERISLIRHELCHISTHPLSNWTKDLIERLVPDDKVFREWLLKEHQLLLEGSICDIELMLKRARDACPICDATYTGGLDSQTCPECGSDIATHTNDENGLIERLEEKADQRGWPDSMLLREAATALRTAHSSETEAPDKVASVSRFILSTITMEGINKLGGTDEYARQIIALLAPIAQEAEEPEPK